MMSKVCPPTVIVAVRCVCVVFCVAEKLSVPSPVPVAPEVIVNQLPSLVATAVQAQPAVAPTRAVPFCTVLSMIEKIGEME